VQIWSGPHPEDGSPLEVQDGPPEGAVPPDLSVEPQLTAPIGPDFDKEMLEDVAKRLFASVR
jgi:Mn-containing catalase